LLSFYTLVERSIGGVPMKSMKLGVWVVVGIALAMLISVGFLGSERSVSAQDSTDPVFVGAGDIASCARTGDEATAKVLEDIVAAAPTTTTVFTTGDNAYESGTASEYLDCYAPSWGRQKAITYPTVGNHEYYASGNASGYFDYFGADRVSYDATTKGYYSYNLGQWHMVALNSMCEKVGGCGATSPMVTWLKKDLAANPRTCTLAYFHHPVFSSGPLSGGVNAKMKPSWEVLYAAKADVVLNGHLHNYERFAPQTPSGAADPQGIREFVVGTGGYSLNTFKNKLQNSEVRNSSNYGVLKLTLHSTTYDWQFVTAPGGTVTDSGSDSCNGGGEPPPADTTPPRVSSTVPGANATGVAPGANITATFSEAMNVNFINGTTVKLFRAGTTTEIGAVVSYDATAKKAILNPNANLQLGTKYKAVVTTGAQDLAGNRLDQNSSLSGLQQKAWTFTIRN
jgi:hypothetical protein